MCWGLKRVGVRLIILWASERLMDAVGTVLGEVEAVTGIRPLCNGSPLWPSPIGNDVLLTPRFVRFKGCVRNAAVGVLGAARRVAILVFLLAKVREGLM